jgi:hypothetical protein
MTMELMPAAGQERQIWGQETEVQPVTYAKSVVLGGGANTRHMYESLDVIGADVSNLDPLTFSIDPGHFLHVDTPERQAALNDEIGNGAYERAYVSLPADLHEKTVRELLRHVGAGALKTIIVPKPYIEGSIEDLVSLRTEVTKTAEERARKTGLSVDTKADPLVVIHEHYLAKSVYQAFRKQLPYMLEHLGRLSSVTTTIQEAITIEKEGRLNALKSGVLNDLVPHTTSIGVDIQKVVNETGLQTVANDFVIESVETYRDKDSQLADPNADTAFKLRGNATLTDHQTGEVHPLTFIQSGGKGIGSENNKKLMLEFVHPQLGISTVVVDLKKNEFVHLPEQVRHLFPEDAVYNDDGYGNVIRDGLGKGDLSGYQSVKDAEVVTKFTILYNRLRQDTPTPCDKNISL